MLNKRKDNNFGMFFLALIVLLVVGVVWDRLLWIRIVAYVKARNAGVDHGPFA